MFVARQYRKSKKEKEKLYRLATNVITLNSLFMANTINPKKGRGQPLLFDYKFGAIMT